MKSIEISGEARLAIEKAIHCYFESRRQKVSEFTERHFSIQETWKLQKSYFFKDLIRYPANSLWTIPYLTLKQSFDSIQKLGLRKFSSFLSLVPTGVKTQYQKQIENFITEELLEISTKPNSNALIKAIEDELPANFHGEIGKILRIQFHLKEKLEKYSTNRQFISDIAGNLSIMGMGWFFFGNHDLSLSAISRKIAQRFAHDKAASSFFFGKNLGHSFYQLFPPQPTKMQIFTATLVISLFVIAISLACHIIMDPIREKLRLQEGNLIDFLNEMENALLLEMSQFYKKQHLSMEHIPVETKKNA